MEQVKKGRDIAYAFGNFSGGIIGYAMASWYMFFYVDHLGLPLSMYSTAMVIYGIWNAINDPLMGILSDRTRSRWGRRKPYMLFGAIPFGISLVLLFTPPSMLISTQTRLFIYFVSAMCLFDTFFTMTMLNWSAVLPEMYLDPKHRGRVNVYAQILGVLGAMLATLGVQPIINAYGYPAMSIIFGVVGTGTMLLSAWGVREQARDRQPKPMSVWDSFRETLSNKAFVICVISVLLIETAKVFATSTIAFYSKYVMGNDMGVTIIMGTMFVASMVFAPVVNLLFRKFGAKKTYMVTTFVFAAACCGFLVAPNIIVAAVVAGVVGFGVSGIMIMPNILYAEIIDEDQVKTGQRREGAYYGINALIMRLSVIIHGAVSALILEQTGYSSALETQHSAAVWGIRMLMGLLPLVFSAIALGVVARYPANPKRLLAVQAAVRDMNRGAGEGTEG